MIRQEHITFTKPDNNMIQYIAEHMRKWDVFECKAVGLNPLNGLTSSIAECPDSRIIMADGEPIGAMGSKPAINGGAVYWLLGTDKINSYAKEFYIKSQQILKEYLKQYTYLTNVICKDHAESVRWLSRLGAEFDENTIRLLGREFQRFFIYRR